MVAQIEIPRETLISMLHVIRHFEEQGVSIPGHIARASKWGDLTEARRDLEFQLAKAYGER